ncbi:NAD-dependent epimerase [Alteromonas macleodii]|uniref:3-beta hydroxysteroid dehydrogenase/isomerase family protein n=1 Tax=Alteromonas macleodii TaxID=28108 RepID=A0AB36FQ35_ALTMA|nr:NAD-dependent epimerase [Alteromonas macleodii]OES29405.1 3-beta hydroxysteroid dehydrogenase/isomerase family protein [Alteromonas macleodii]OES29831.1 3-beta hydroxysteroid dehydrogenase/isomerase family protein [Alteromonas macleodii]OES30535.1 3-beta hydroxysteroid dehydrogenase/isomerase family protein [Alteromonas macleodii]OES40360.1 3-beta hydroxysteroid dehydrogenase/isomerase family protein [Alteromonas macleodii]OZB92523.1 capsular biosynthesis protein CpsI [Alteromonas macleodii|tara:strand:+ start:2756 stop:3772 length:1017 start_codon:yes stop_codon:yes gene_type:complete
MKILVTGAAGFIGAAVSQYLINRGDQVVGIDNINDYYDVNLKHARLDEIRSSTAADLFSFIEMGVEERDKMAALFEEHKFDRVVHLAAQAGVRYSLENPNAYVDSNIVGFVNILEGCRHNNVEHLVYASSSSVYGANETMPFSEQHNVDHQVSLYAASKKANELMAHTYSHLYNLPTTGLRFFTVYGPWGRPDMALFKFTKAILEGKTIQVYNYGNHRRDFTYIDDIVEGVIRSLDNVAKPNENWDGSNPDPSTSKAPYKVYNIGAQTPVHLLKFIETLESALGIEAKKELLPMQPGDVPDTYADVSSLVEDTGYQPSTDVETGVKAFVDWYRDFYNV